MSLRRRTKPTGERRRRKANGEGFTLLELMIALLILGIVLGAVAPAFYGVLKAGTITNYRSVANGIAVQSTEQLRSYAYYQVGFSTAPTGCPNTASNPLVLVGFTTPVDGLVTNEPTEQVGTVTYSILRCVNWVNSTVTNDTLAYKETSVKVSWTVDGVSSSLSQTSALYPGGNGAYTSGGENDYEPAQTTTTVGNAPSSPATASGSTTSSDPNFVPGYQLAISWPAVSGATSYDVWFSPTNPGTYPVSSMSDAQVDMDVTGTSDTIDVQPNTNYYIQVVAVNAAGPSNPVSITPWPINSGPAGGTTTTTTAPTTTTTVPSGTTTTTTTTSTTTTSTTTTTVSTCTATKVSVTPAGQSSNNKQAYLNSSGLTLIPNSGSFSVVVTVSGTGCIPQVAYNTTGCFPGNPGCAPSYLSSYTLAGNQYTFLTSPSLSWSDKATEYFIPVINGTQSTTLSAQSYVCVQDTSNNGGKCL